MQRSTASQRPILVVWWTGLIGALIATMVILKEVALVLRALRDIYRLAGFIREAARGVNANVAATERLASTAGPARDLRDVTSALAAAAAATERKLDTLVAGPTPQGG